MCQPGSSVGLQSWRTRSRKHCQRCMQTIAPMEWGVDWKVPVGWETGMPPSGEDVWMSPSKNRQHLSTVVLLGGKCMCEACFLWEFSTGKQGIQESSGEHGNLQQGIAGHKGVQAGRAGGLPVGLLFLTGCCGFITSLSVSFACYCILLDPCLKAPSSLFQSY